MSDAFSISVQSLQNDMRKLEVVSHNLSNATTAGFRRQVLASQPFGAVFDGQQVAQSTPPLGQTVTDRRAGAFQATGRPLDLAIQGKAFFVIQGSEGVLYTRRGDFQLGPDGRLETADGAAVLGTQGELFLPPGNYAVDATGQIRVNGDLVGQLRLAELAEGTDLQAQGAAGYAAQAGAAQTDELQSTVRAGFLEASNVVPMQEMVSMMETMRHFEASQRLLQGYDDALGRAIQKLGEV